MILRLKLYIAGSSVKSEAAIRNLEQALSDLDKGEFELTVIDVLKHPHMAEEDFVLATPTLIRTFPEPVKRTVGDLSDSQTLLRSLELGSIQRREMS